MDVASANSRESGSYKGDGREPRRRGRRKSNILRIGRNRMKESKNFKKTTAFKNYTDGMYGLKEEE